MEKIFGNNNLNNIFWKYDGYWEKTILFIGSPKGEIARYMNEFPHENNSAIARLFEVKFTWATLSAKKYFFQKIPRTPP
jgi:hypothetical protein